MAHKGWTRIEGSHGLGGIEIKLAGGAMPDGVFSGYGAIFDEPHQTSSWQVPSDWSDVVKPGAFERTLAEHAARGTRPAMLLQHDMGEPIGVWTSTVEDARGLAVEGQLTIEVADVADTYKLMKSGAIPGLSIGFSVANAALNEKTRTREILEVDLYEISAVTIPAISGAQIEDVKSAVFERDPRNIRELESILRDAGLTRSEAKALCAEGFKALSGQRDADDIAEQLQSLINTIRG